MYKVKRKIKLGTQQKQKYIGRETIQKLTSRYQDHRQLDILRIEQLSEESVQIAYDHINQCIKAQNIAIKDIYDKTGEKSYDQALFLSSHEAEGGGDDN